MAKLNKDELAAMREARTNAMNKALKDFDLHTDKKRAAYAATCDAETSVLLVASVDEEGFHMTSANAVRYQPQDTGAGTLFLSGKKDIYLAKGFLEAQGYSEEEGWPVALNVTMAFPALVEVEAEPEKPKRKSAKDTQGSKKRQTKPLSNADVNKQAREAGYAEELGADVAAEKDAAKDIIRTATTNITQCITKPKKPWLITSAKARTVIRDEAAELIEMGVPEDKARDIVEAVLLKKKYIRKK